MLNALRMSGVNSGMDIESIVKAMTAATKLRITNNQKKVLRLQAQQLAYRDVIGKLQTFKSNYFDILNRNTYLKSPTIFKGAKATTTFNGVEGTLPSGVKVTAAAGAVPATYEVTLTGKAAQAKITGTELAAATPIDLSAVNAAAAGDTLQFSLAVNGAVRHFNVEVGAGQTGLEAVNDALKSAYGATNDGKGIVSIDTNGVISATNRSTLAVSEIVKGGDEYSFAFDSLPGDGTNTNTVLNNTVRIQVGDTVQEISFGTAESGYFNILFDGSGNYVQAGDVDSHLDTLAGGDAAKKAELQAEY